MKFIKNLKQRIKIMGNFFWFLVTAPLFVKINKYETPSLFMVLVSWFIWACLTFFVVGTVFSKIGGSGPKWFEGVIENPSGLILNKYFGWSLILLSSYYLYINFRNLWNKEAIKKFLLDTDWKDEEYEKLKLQERKAKEKLRN